VAARVPTRVFAGTPDAPRLLDLLVGSRLVTTTQDTATIAHESLVRAWPRLRTWLDEDVEGQRILAHLQGAADGWDLAGRPEDELYRGARLASALEWIGRSRPVLAPVEVEFLDASRTHEADSQARREAEFAQQVRRNRQLRGALAGLVAALTIAVLAGSLALVNGRHASDAAARADMAAAASDAGRLGALAASGVPYDRALLYAAQAESVDPSPSSDSALFATLLRGNTVTAALRLPADATGLAFDAEGHLWTAAANGHVLSQPAAGGPPSADINVGQHASGLAVTPGGQVLVATWQGIVEIDPASGAVSQPGPTGNPFLWALSPDGRTVVSEGSTADGYRAPSLLVWRLAGSSPTEVKLDSMPMRILGCGPRTACVLTEDRHLLRVRYHDGSIASDVPIPGASPPGEPRLAAASNGRRVAIPSADGLIRIVDPVTGSVVRTLAGGSQNPIALAFSPDGTRLAGADDSTALVWDLDRVGLPLRLPGHAGRINVAAWAPDGSTLATGSTDDTVLRWDTTGRHGVGRLVTDQLGGDTSTVWPTAHGTVIGQRGGRLLLVDPDTGAIQTLAGPTGADIATARAAPTGDLLVSADTNGTTAVWDLRTATAVGQVQGLPKADMARFGPDTWVSPNGQLAATMRDDTGPYVVDLAAHRILRHLPAPPGEGATWTAVQGWTADGSALLVTRDLGDAGSELLTMDATTGDVDLRVPLGTGSAMEAAADPRGKFLAVAMADSTVHILDPNNGRAIVPPLKAIEGQAVNLSISPDGRWMSVSGWPPQLTVWDTTTFHQVGIPLPLDDLELEARARFAPNGDLIATTGHTLRDFQVDPDLWRQQACQEAGRTLTQEEYRDILPNHPYRPACAQAPVRHQQQLAEAGAR
jgi:WD40 repeat protein